MDELSDMTDQTVKPRCQFGNHVGPVQQYTECCMACGKNIYGLDDEGGPPWLRRLNEQQRESRPGSLDMPDEINW